MITSTVNHEALRRRQERLESQRRSNRTVNYEALKRREERLEKQQEEQKPHDERMYAENPFTKEKRNIVRDGNVLYDYINQNLDDSTTIESYKYK